MLAEVASPTVSDDGPNNTIMDLELRSSSIDARSIGSKLDDLTDDLVAKDRRCVCSSTTADGMKVATADGAGQDSYEDLPLLGG